MRRVYIKKGENRKDYLLRVVVAFIDDYIENNELNCVVYDNAECDYYCLRDDILISLEEGEL